MQILIDKLIGFIRLIPLFLLLCGFLTRKQQDREKWKRHFLFLFDLCFLFCVTLFERVGQGIGRIVILKPFQTWQTDTAGKVFCIANILLFVPFGFLLPMVERKADKIWKAAATGFCLSIGIEFVQYIFALGQSETDDVIMNTAGAAFGYGIYRFAERRKA